MQIRLNMLVVLIAMTSTLIISEPTFGNPIFPNEKFSGGFFNVTWGGDKTDKNPLFDTVPPAGTAQGNLKFEWTKDGNPHPDYGNYDKTNATNVRLKTRFFRPDDDTITDWKQTITNGDGTTDVIAGNIQQDSPWSFHPLSELPIIPYRIPDLAPTQGGLTIFTAINLDLYLANNSNGFLNGNWMDEQTLNSLGVNIVDGQIPGVEGIFWATSEFTLDPNSTTGWVPVGGSSALLNSANFQTVNGDIVILATHEAIPIPEPSTIILFAIGILGIIGMGYRQRKKAA